MSFELTPIPVNDDILDAVASGSYYSPHSVLGAHLGDDGVTIRVVAHLADAVDIITPTGAYAATHERGGIWVAALPSKEITAYRVSVTYGEDTTVRDDPYRYLPTLGEMDTYLISEGRHENLWNVLGAHVKTYTDELDGRSYVWGSSNWVSLSPVTRLGHVFKVEPAHSSPWAQA